MCVGDYVDLAASTVNLQTKQPVASVQTAKREDVIRDRMMQAALRNTEYAIRTPSTDTGTERSGSA
jgi:hypothetical protein